MMIKSDKIKPFSISDVIIFVLLAISSFFIFQHGDIIHTTTSSLAYLKGHFLSFYDYNATVVDHNNYMPTTYIIYAIWNIPIYFLGLFQGNYPYIEPIALFYNKLLGVILYIASSYILYKIAIQSGFGREKSKIVAVIFLSSPIAFFSQFIFGQYDIFTLFFLLLGVLFLLKGSYYYIIFFSIAITLKYHSLLLLLPFILIREKNIFKLALIGLALITPFLIEVLIYSHSSAFIDGVFNFRAAKVFKWWTYVALIILFTFAYFKRVDGEVERIKWGIFYSVAVVFIIYGLSFWHPQWLLLGMPFLALSVAVNKHYKKLLLLDIAMMAVFLSQTVIQFPSNVDQNLFNLGILQVVTATDINSYLPMREFIPNIHKYFYFSLLSGCFLIYLILSYPYFMKDKLDDDITDAVPLIRVRFIIGVLLFILPAFMSFFASYYRL